MAYSADATRKASSARFRSMTGFAEAIEPARGSRYTRGMTTREKVMQVAQDLPDDASLEDAMERILLLAKIERGIQQADAGQTIPHEQVKEKMAKWLK